MKKLAIEVLKYVVALLAFCLVLAIVAGLCFALGKLFETIGPVVVGTIAALFCVGILIYAVCGMKRTIFDEGEF